MKRKDKNKTTEATFNGKKIKGFITSKRQEIIQYGMKGGERRNGEKTLVFAHKR